MKNYFKKAFTLAEILIVLAVIGVITAILLPAAHHITPDENVLKFKKAHNALYSAIRELANSDKYYLDGDLGIKADGVLIYENPSFYFCHTLTDVLTIKSSNCDIATINHTSTLDIATGEQITEAQLPDRSPKEVTAEKMLKSKQYLDNICKTNYSPNTKDYISFVTPDNVNWYEIGRVGFGWQNNTVDDATLFRRFSAPDQSPPTYPDSNGMDRMYKIFCFDIDEPDKGEDPFGYGIRADGKILNGIRADEWLNKSIQQN